MTSPNDADAFRTSLEQRAKAAKGLEHDLLSEVPQLYGAPDCLAPDGDPGISLARIHRDELKRRNGGGVPDTRTRRADVALPFEGTVLIIGLIAIAVLIFVE